LGLSRALVKFNGEFQRSLKDLDYLKRDPRQKERKKPGKKKARKSPQWSKR
jgi:small subunit ribosomal protein S9